MRQSFRNCFLSTCSYRVGLHKISKKLNKNQKLDFYFHLTEKHDIQSKLLRKILLQKIREKTFFLNSNQG